MRPLHFLGSVCKGVASYLAMVAGGLTLYLTLAPLFGYLPYSDRPGPGWYGTFPALNWSDFWSNAWHMLQFGVFIALLIAIGGLAIVLPVRVREIFGPPTVVFRIFGALWSAVVTAYFVLGAGWYVALDTSSWAVSVVLASVFGWWLLPGRQGNDSPAPNKPMHLLARLGVQRKGR